MPRRGVYICSTVNAARPQGEEQMTTHRHIQISELQYSTECAARSARRAAANLARIGNNRGADHYYWRAMRLDYISARCAARMEA